MGRRRKVAVAEERSVENNENCAPKSKQPKTKEKPAKKFKNEPEWLSNDGSVVAKLILSIQKSDCNNMKVIAELSKLYNKVSRQFLDLTNHVLTGFVYFRWDTKPS